MDNIQKAMRHIQDGAQESGRRKRIPFEAFLQVVQQNPIETLFEMCSRFSTICSKPMWEAVWMNTPNDPESIQYVKYDCSGLFVQNMDRPFFADRLFANRLVNHVEALRMGAQQNKIYIFDGPHGCGKSTFLNNLLKRFEEYANSAEGTRYETIWRLDRRLFPRERRGRPIPFLSKTC
jgi:hypothetical protein